MGTPTISKLWQGNGANGHIPPDVLTVSAHKHQMPEPLDSNCGQLASKELVGISVDRFWWCSEHVHKLVKNIAVLADNGAQTSA